MQICSKCRKKKEVSEFHRDKSKKSGYKSHCKQCVKHAFENYKDMGLYQKRLGRYKKQRQVERQERPQAAWAKSVASNLGKRSNLPVEINRQWLEANVGTHCPCLGIEFLFCQGKTTAASPSVDRVDSSLGYTEDNCWIISHKANRIKSDATVAEIEAVAAAVRSRWSEE